MAMINNMTNFMDTVDKKADGNMNAGGQQKLEAQVKQSKGMKQDDAIALQIVKDGLDAARRQIEAVKMPQEKKVIEQTAEDVLMAAMEQVKGNAQTGQDVSKLAQSKAQKGMMKNALTQQQGQGMPQGKPPGLAGMLKQAAGPQLSMPGGKPPMPGGIAMAGGKPPMPGGMPMPGGKPPMPGGMPGGMPPSAPMARGGLARFQAGGDVDIEDPRKKEKGMLRRGLEYVAENPLQSLGTVALGAASLHPIGRGISAARAGAPGLMSGAKNLLQKTYSKKVPVQTSKRGAQYTTATPTGAAKFLKKGEPIPRQRDLGRMSTTAGIAGAGMLGLDALTDPLPEGQAPQGMPEGQGPSAPMTPQMTEREMLMARKPTLPERGERSFTDKFETMAANLEGGSQSALRALKAQEEADFKQVYDKALADQEMWATELKDLTTRDVSKMGNLRQYATDLQKAKANIAKLIYDSSNIKLLEMQAMGGDEKAIAALEQAKQMVLVQIAAMEGVTGIADQEKAVLRALGDVMGLPATQGVSLDQRAQQALANAPAT